jgi:hypothetical protein
MIILGMGPDGGGMGRCTVFPCMHLMDSVILTPARCQLHAGPIKLNKVIHENGVAAYKLVLL